MTAFGTIRGAVDAVKRGAENYLTKPLEPDAVSAVIERAMEKARLFHETRALRDRLRERNVEGHIVSADPKMEAVLELVGQVGPSKATVLITGESGTGKELIAEALHGASP
jgi:DNA-binding NtrC family response regulator